MPSFAGQWGPEVLEGIDAGGGSYPLVDESFTIYEPDNVTLATLYTDRYMETEAPNPAVTSSIGNATFYAAPGKYRLATAYANFPINVARDPYYGGFDSGLLAARPDYSGVPTGYAYFASDDNGGTLWIAGASDYVQAAPTLADASGIILERAYNRTVQSGFSAVTDVTDLEIEFTVATQPVEVEVDLPYCASPTANTTLCLRICDAANVIKESSFASVSTNSAAIRLRCVEYIATPGTYTRKARILRFAGSGTVTVQGGDISGDTITNTIKATTK